MTSLALCMIVKNEGESLAACLGSVARYVDEIVIVDTGSTDQTKMVAQHFKAKIIDFTPETNPEAFFIDDETTGAPGPYTGQLCLGDFGAARNVSFDAATKDHCLWIDADDILVGGEHLRRELDAGVAAGATAHWMIYDYAFAGEQPICQLWRERILKRGLGRWLNPIHEVHDLPPGSLSRHLYNIRVRHRREQIKRLIPGIAHRNYKVLRRQYEAARPNVDPRTLFYLGNEARHLNEEEAIGYYEAYLRASGWPEERAVARLFLGQMHEKRQDMEAAFRAYSSATTDYPANPDSWFGLARLSYWRERWEDAVRYAERGFELGNPHSAIMFNPLERTFAPHQFYNLALSKLGRVHEALGSCKKGLAVMEDPNLRHNEKLYEDFLKANPSKPQQAAKGVQTQLQFTQDYPEDSGPLPGYLVAGMALQVWKEMLRHDEVVKARAYLDALPFFVENFDGITKAKAKTEELLALVGTDEALLKYYATHEVSEAWPLEQEMPTHYHQRARLDAVLRHVGRAQGLYVLDVGCQDGWLANRLAMRGHKVTGIDFSAKHLEIARANAARLSLPACYVEGFASDITDALHPDREVPNEAVMPPWCEAGDRQYDLILCTEMIEHLVDAPGLLRELRAHLKPGGRLLLSTPRGAWFGGQTIEKGGVRYGNGWDEPREHIRAYSLEGLERELGQRFDVISCYGLPVPNPDWQGQAHIFAECGVLAGKIVNPHALDIVIWTGPAVEWWSPLSPETTGIGGSETACIEVARWLADAGHKVTVYSDCPNMDGIYDRVRYRHFGDFKRADCDVFISSRQLHVMDYPINAKATFLWAHDIHCGPPTPDNERRLLQFDHVLALSQWHKDFLCHTYPTLHPDTVIVTRNGIDPQRFTEVCGAVKVNKVIYSSSANRGLDKLLNLWPKIRQRVPSAELHVFYGFESWEASVQGDAQQLAEIAEYKRRLAETEGVVYRGRIKQRDLAREMLEAKVWAYPTSFTETFCVTALEAQAAGCVPVVTPVAALSETVKHGVFCTCAGLDFIDQVAHLLEDEGARDPIADAGRRWALTKTWQALACDWVFMFERAITERAAGYVPRYRSAA